MTKYGIRIYYTDRQPEEHDVSDYLWITQIYMFFYSLWNPRVGLQILER